MFISQGRGFLSACAVWVSSNVFIPIGWNSHSRENCSRVLQTGHFTNHSGEITCATQSFEENVDEQLIKLQSGHRCDAVRAYKRPTKSHALQVSNILQPPLPKKAAKLPKWKRLMVIMQRIRKIALCQPRTFRVTHSSLLLCI